VTNTPASTSSISASRGPWLPRRSLSIVAIVAIVATIMVPFARPAFADAPVNTSPPELYPDESRPWISKGIYLGIGDWDPWPDSYMEEWLLCGDAADIGSCDVIEGVTGSYWTITDTVTVGGEPVATEGLRLRGRVTAVRGGLSTVAVSAATEPIEILPAPQIRDGRAPEVSPSQALPWVGTQIYLNSGSWSPSYDTLSIQWLLCTDGADQANCADVPDSTNYDLLIPATVDLGDGDVSTVGRFIRARVTATNAAGSTVVVTAALVDPIVELPAPQPRPGREPYVYPAELLPWVGTDVQLDTGSWSPDYDALSQQWLICSDATDETSCSDLPDGTGQSLRIPATVDLGDGDVSTVGLFLRARLEAGNAAGATTFVTAAIVDPIAAAPSVPVLLNAVRLQTDRIPWVGTYAYASWANWSPGPDQREWRWLSCPDSESVGDCVPIEGATNDSLELAEELAGRFLRVVERASIDGGETFAESVSLPSTRAVRVLGAPEFLELFIEAADGFAVRSRVRARGDWGPPDTEFSYQWLACSNTSSTDSCTVIEGATNDRLDLTAALVGQHVRFRITGTRDGYDPVSADSPASPPVSRAQMVDNGRLRFGGGGQESSTVPNPRDSVTGTGMFAQPFYWDEVRQRWFKLTFSDYPLDIAVGAGAGNRKANDSAGHWTGATVRDSQRSPSAFSPATTDTSDFTLVSTYENGVRRGYGTIIASNRVTIPSGEVLDLQHLYELGAEASFVKITTTISNRTAAAATNVHLWVGTRDDYIGTDDSPNKYKGTIVDGVFTELTDRTSPASALLITSGNAGMSATSEGVLFYSTTRGTNMAHAGCCSFGNSTDIDPTSVGTRQLDRDGSYALHLPIGDLPAGGSRTLIWYYAAGALSDIEDIIRAVAQAAAPQVEIGNGQVTLVWERPDVEETITGYRIRYSSDGGETWTSVDVPPTPLSYTITGLTNGADYRFQIAPLTAGGQLDYSPASESATPGLPTNVTPPRISGTAQATRTLTVIDPDSHWVNNGSEPMTTTWQWTRDGVDIPGATGSTLVVDESWIGSRIQLIASRTNEVGTTSVTSAATPDVIELSIGDPSPPRNLSASPRPGGALVDFDPPSDDGGSDIVRYEVEVDGSGEWLPVGASSPVLVDGLTNDRSVSLRLRAVNATGTSLPSAAVTVVPRSAPSAPQELTAARTEDGLLELGWAAPASDGGIDITGYILEMSTDGVTWIPISGTLDPSSRGTLLDGLVAGTTYWLRIAATNVAGTSPWAEFEPVTVPQEQSGTDPGRDSESDAAVPVLVIPGSGEPQGVGPGALLPNRINTGGGLEGRISVRIFPVLFAVGLGVWLVMLQGRRRGLSRVGIG
jgi:hypothetical protein